MFDGIVVAKRACDHCHRVGLVALIPGDRDDEPYNVATGKQPLAICGRCINRLQRFTFYLRRLEAAPPKKPRKRALRQPRAIAAPSSPSDHEAGELVQVPGDRSLAGQPG